MGRPSKYSPELGEKICEKIATSNKGLKRICDENDEFPSYVTVFAWLGDENKKEFLNRYARAREGQADLLSDEIVEISDDSTNDTQTDEDGNEIVNHDHINRARLRVDARKWKASKLAPKKYGDKVEIDQFNRGDVTIKVIRE